jgi:hypothetical protein
MKRLSEFSAAAALASPNPTETETADTIFDASAIIGESEKVLGDGAQIGDILALLNIQPIGREIYEDFHIFWREYISLPSQVRRDAVKVAKERFLEKYQPGRVSIIYFNALWCATGTHEVGEMAISNFNEWKSINSEKLIF